VTELYIITLFLMCNVEFFTCVCYFIAVMHVSSLYINELEQRFNFLSVFVSISPRGQFVCVSVGSIVF